MTQYATIATPGVDSFTAPGGLDPVVRGFSTAYANPSDASTVQQSAATHGVQVILTATPLTTIWPGGGPNDINELAVLAGIVLSGLPLGLGWYVHQGPRTAAGVLASLTAAEALGLGTVAYFPPGTYDVGNGLSLSGFSCQILGAGASGDPAATMGGTVFYASTQSGPVLDFTGWVPPAHFQGKVRHSGFGVRGSGAADPTKANSGVRLAAISSTCFADIAVSNTGGAAWEHVQSIGNAVYLCDFERIVLSTPISAKTNDVPYMIMNESNGNRFRGIGFRSLASSADVGVSGAVVIVGNASHSGHDNKWDACWMENLHVPDTGTLISNAGNVNIHDGWQFFDCFKESGAAGTSYARFTAPTTPNFGGNLWRGLVPGKGTGTTDIDCGLDMQQSNNAVTGVKGYKGTNVIIASGVQNTSVRLGGALSTATDPAVVDNSGNTTNLIVDDYLQFQANTGGIDGVWTAYTPTIGGTGWALGNATLNGRWATVGKTVHWSVSIVWGTTTTFGTGGLTVALPTARTTASSAFPLTASATKTGSNIYDLWGQYSTTTTASLYTLGSLGVAAPVTATNPVTFASGDIVTVSGTYQTP